MKLAATHILRALFAQETDLKSKLNIEEIYEPYVISKVTCRPGRNAGY